ncbi:hypothetical protein QE359_000060 [Curtobacterium sp. SORGH_AS776]|nr:hypothetical protein [Curtobacterium sp. SORGH_AS_0776]MDR6169031.1 hypothetical protein [Curtobacterium sp. SORGH_AS_0776]
MRPATAAVTAAATAALDPMPRAVGTSLSTRTWKRRSVTPKCRSVAVTAVTVGITAAGARSSGPVCTVDSRWCPSASSIGVTVATTTASMTGRTSAGAP